MIRTYAIVKVSVPSSEMEKIRAYVQYISGGTVSTITQYLENQVLHFASAFGPECTGIVQSTGTEEV